MKNIFKARNLIIASLILNVCSYTAWFFLNKSTPILYFSLSLLCSFYLFKIKLEPSIQLLINLAVPFIVGSYYIGRYAPLWGKVTFGIIAGSLIILLLVIGLRNMFGKGKKRDQLFGKA
jgi:hypothetical protein